ncbi:hypothetical protein IFM89_017696 [Coptis chinensis]|uniref:Myb/SANT-like domain-containing protein n=1 Tax=Coptis chinensis TaxID=261450 RepID=A0A835I1K6_9MAGN|nr:hypothetical protein IFM89_017696 [Coptis chinensis]
MYARCGELDEAVKVFDEVSQRGISDVVSWNSIVGAFVRSGEVGRALNMFGGMNSRGVGLRADVASLVNILPACASVGALMQGCCGGLVQVCVMLVCGSMWDEIQKYVEEIDGRMGSDEGCGVQLDRNRELIMRRTTRERRAVATLVVVVIAQAVMAYYDWWYRIYMTRRRVVRAIQAPVPRAPLMARRAGNSSKGKGVVSEGEVTKPPVPRQKPIRWYPSMDEILIEVLLEKTLNGLGRKSDNGWKPETLKEVVEAVNQRLNMSIGNDNVRSRLKTMKKDYLAAKAAVEASGDHVAWEEYCKAHPTARPLRKKMFPHFEEACIVFGSDMATGEGGNARHDDEEVVILEEEVGDEGAENTEEESSQPPSPHPNANDGDSSPGESFVVGDSTQAGSRRITTPPLVKRKRSRLGLEAMPPPPDFKELTEAVRQLTNAFTPVDPSTLLIAALEELPNMEPDLMLRAGPLICW